MSLLYLASRKKVYYLSTMYNSPTGQFPIENSDLYHLWMEEKMHIERNKWFLSQQAGHDVGLIYAKYNWDMNHRKKWWDTATGKK